MLKGRDYYLPKSNNYLSNEPDYWVLIDTLNRIMPTDFESHARENLQPLPVLNGEYEDNPKLFNLHSQLTRERSSLYNTWVNSVVTVSELEAFKIWRSSQNTGNWYDNIIQQGFFPQITSQVDTFIDEQPLAQILAPQAVITNESFKHPIESAIIVGAAAIASSAIAAGSGAATSEGALLGQTGLLSETGVAATFAEPVALTAPVLTTGATLGETAGWTAFINEANDFLGETNQFLRSPIGEILADNLNGGKNESFVPDPNYSASKDNDIFFIIILMTTSFLFLIF